MNIRGLFNAKAILVEQKWYYLTPKDISPKATGVRTHLLRARSPVLSI